MKDHNEMTVDEARDELARNAGYKPTQNHWHHPKHGCCHFNDHPIPATLDEAAKLPEGWLPKIEEIAASHWVAKAFPPDGNPYSMEADGTTELEARFRLRVAVTRAMAKEAGE